MSIVILLTNYATYLVGTWKERERFNTKELFDDHAKINNQRAVIQEI